MKEARIFLPSTVQAEMEAEAREHYPNESGGVLLGYTGGPQDLDIQVLYQVGPGPNAVHKSHRFEPDAEWQDSQIALVYESSGRIASYLGDWHSHPRGGVTPSSLDRSTARAIAKHPEARAPNPLILILSKGPKEWAMAGYRRSRHRLRTAGLVLDHPEPKSFGIDDADQDSWPVGREGQPAPERR